MARSRELRFVFSGDDRDLKRAFASVRKDTSSLGRDIGHFTTSAAKSFGLLGAAVGTGLVVELKRSHDAYRESAKVGRQTEAVLKSTGGQAHVTAKDIDRLSRSISKKAGIDDEAVQSAANVLLTFTKVRNEVGKNNDIFSQAVPVIADMSAALGTDLQSSTIQVGKALNDPIKGVTALQRVGVSFTKDQKEQIKTLVETGHQLDAQKLILRELNTEFGGSGKAQADGFDRMKVAVENVEESIGKGLDPALQGIADEMTKVAEKVTPEIEKVSTRIGRIFDKDISLGDKLKLSGQEIQKAFDPLAKEGKRAFERAKLGEKLGKAFEDAAPKIADAAAAAAPRAAGAFVRAFKNAGPWGQLITAAFLAQRLGAFNAAGRGASSLFVAGVKRAIGGPLKRAFQTSATSAGTAAAASASEAMASQMPTSMSKGRIGRMRAPIVAAFRGIGLLAGAAAGLAIVAEIEKAIGGGFKDKSGSPAIPGDPTDKRNTVGGFIEDKLGVDIPGFAMGGTIRGKVPGQGRGDTVPAMLEPGEFVIRRKVVERFGPTFFAAINNAKGVQHFAGGGMVSGDTDVRPGLLGKLRAMASATGRAIFINSGRRTIAEQQVLYNRYISGNGPIAAKPNANAPHVRGIAADIRPGRETFGSVATRFGMAFTVPSESWHIQDTGGAAAGGSGGAVGEGTDNASSGPTKQELQQRAATRFDSKVIRPIVRKFQGPLTKLGRQSASLGASVEGSDRALSRIERRNDLTDEDLGDPTQRVNRLFELSGLTRFQQNRIALAKSQAAVKRREIAKYRRLIRELKAAGKKAPPGARGKLNERLKTYQGRIADLKHDLRTLGEFIEDTQDDIADLGKQTQEAIDAEPTKAFDTYGAVQESLGLQVDAGVITQAQADAFLAQTRTDLLAGKGGPLTDPQRWQIMADARTATSEDRSGELIDAVKGLKASIDEQNALASSIAGTSHAAAIGALSKWVDGEITAGWNQRRQSAGNGTGANY